MKAQHLPIVAACAIAAQCIASAASAATDPTGVWLNDTGRGAVEIKPCGTALCGHVVAVMNAADRKGCGKQIIGDAHPAAGGVWDGGWIYSPEKRKNYDVELKPLSDGTLRVVGYAGTKLFSRTMIWKRAPADLERCDVAATAPKSDAPPSPGAPHAPTGAQGAAAKQPDAPVAATATGTDAGKSASSSTPVAAASQPVATSPAEAAKPAPSAATPPVQPAPVPASASASASPPPVPADQQADNDAGEAPGQRSKAKRGGLNIGDLNLGDLKVEKIIKRTNDGDCKIDLPFVKVQFSCDD